MRKFLSYILLPIFLCLMVSSKQKNSETLTVRVSNISEVKGNLMVAVFNAEKKFPEESVALQRLVIPVSATTTKFTIKNLTEGAHYALAIYHDKNKNEKLDKNFIGLPTERYGFSNNARGVFGPPSFEEASFIFKQYLTLEIKIE